MSEWSEDLAAQVHELYVVKGLSASATGQAVGLTKSAVNCGAVRRGWLKPVAARPLRRAIPVDVPHPETPTPAPTRRLRKWEAVESLHPKILAEHRVGECLAPVGPEPPDQRMDLHLFCCNPVEARGARYCRAHGDLAFMRGA